jgi:hypothetical protein
MTDRITLDLRPDEAIAVLNALNYFANALTASECSTLLGISAEEARVLLQTLSVSVDRQNGFADRP